MLAFINESGIAGGYPADITEWTGEQCGTAWDAAKKWVADAKTGNVRVAPAGGQHAESQASPGDTYEGGPESAADVDGGEIASRAAQLEIEKLLAASTPRRNWVWCQKTLGLTEGKDGPQIGDLTIQQAARLKAALAAKKAS